MLLRKSLFLLLVLFSGCATTEYVLHERSEADQCVDIGLVWHDSKCMTQGVYNKFYMQSNNHFANF